eukprot:gene13562-28778_t
MIQPLVLPFLLFFRLSFPTAVYRSNYRKESYFGMNANFKFSGDLILGSGSKTRRDILSEMGYKVTIVKPDIDERAIGDRNIGSSIANDLVVRLANAKADAVISKFKDHADDDILVTADQVVTNDGKILEKPITVDEVYEFIRGYGIQPCSTVGSIVLTHLKTGLRVQGVDSTTIIFKTIPDDIISKLIAEGEVFHCAGGLMIEHALVAPYIVSIEGTMDSVMGLSKDLFSTLMLELEIK